jgi:hypothetical protein
MVRNRMGAGKLGRMEKYQNGKKIGSRKVGENGKVFEW